MLLPTTPHLFQNGEEKEKSSNTEKPTLRALNCMSRYGEAVRARETSILCENPLQSLGGLKSLAIFFFGARGLAAEFFFWGGGPN